MNSSCAAGVQQQRRADPDLTWLFEPLPFPQKPEPKENWTTVIIGIRCTDGIVMASDSQVSGGPITELNYPKLQKVQMKDSGIAVIGGAGTVASLELAVRRLGDKVKGGVTDDSAFGDVCKAVYLDVWREQVLGQIRAYGLKATFENVRWVLPRMDDLLQFSILAGAKIRGQPGFCLYKAQIRGETRRVVHYDAIGIGSDIALYILERLLLTESDSSLDRDAHELMFGGREYAQGVALYAIEEVKRVRPEDCGGPTRVWTITKDAQAMCMTEKEMADSRERFEWYRILTWRYRKDRTKQETQN
jgi:20S proteasome alpha/beta subunit